MKSQRSFYLPPSGLKSLLALVIAASLAFVSSRATAATLPPGFTEAQVGSNLSGSPTAMAFAPDGRLFVCQQGGQLRVIKNGVLLSTPFVTLTVDSSGERGLLGIAFDPNFATNHYLYVYYTVATSPIHNRVSRFTAAGDTAAPGSEAVILELNNLSSATNHNGGATHFGPDGKLYIGVGENANGANSFQPAREDVAHQCRRYHPGRQPVLQYCLGKQSRDLGAWPPQPFYLRFSARHNSPVYQRCRRIDLRGDQRRHRWFELRLADNRRPDQQSSFPRPDLLLWTRYKQRDRL